MLLNLGQRLVPHSSFLLLVLPLNSLHLMHKNLSLGIVLRPQDLHLGFEVFVLSQDYLQAFNVVLLFLKQLLLEHYHLLAKAITPLLYLVELSIV